MLITVEVLLLPTWPVNGVKSMEEKFNNMDGDRYPEYPKKMANKEVTEQKLDALMGKAN